MVYRTTDVCSKISDSSFLPLLVKQFFRGLHESLQGLVAVQSVARLLSISSKKMKQNQPGTAHNTRPCKQRHLPQRPLLAANNLPRIASNYTITRSWLACGLHHCSTMHPNSHKHGGYCSRAIRSSQATSPRGMHDARRAVCCHTHAYCPRPRTINAKCSTWCT